MTAALPIPLVAKPWGQDELPAPFDAPTGKRIGEIWFEPPPAMADLLVKYIFASEKLSVQAHPSDPQTSAKGARTYGQSKSAGSSSMRSRARPLASASTQ